MLKYLYLKAALFLVLLCGSAVVSYAQLPDCDNIYLKKTEGIYNYDPRLPVSDINPLKNTITVAANAFYGLTVSPVLGSGDPALTFYSVDAMSGMYTYYDPVAKAWVNTNHGTGSLSAVNIAAGGPYIFNLVGATGKVYRYDGMGPGVLIATVTDFIGGAPYDLVTDCEGNWYILNVRNTKPFLRKYNAEGDLLHSWVVYNPRNDTLSPGAGFAIMGTTLYTDNLVGEGGVTSYLMGKDTLEVLSTVRDRSLFISDDLGSCAGNVPTRPEVTVKAKTSLCDGTEPVSFIATPLAGGPGPVYQWLVNGVPVGSDSPRYTYSPANGDKVVCVMTSNSPCASPPIVSSDTMRIVVYSELPKPPKVVSPLIYCRGVIPAPLEATKTIPESKLYWYTHATGDTASLSAAVPPTKDTGTFTYYVSEGDGDCESPRVPITVVVDEVTLADVTVSHPTTFGGLDGFIKFKTNKAHEVYKVNYRINDVTQPELSLSSDASGYVTIPGLGNGIYTSITITASLGCTSSAYNGPVELAFCENADLSMPNSFTPNGDNINDIFYVRGAGFTVKKFSIYNRLGELVFAKENFRPNDPQYGWNGMMNGKMISDAGGFVYVLETICPVTNAAVLTKGSVLMIK
jgi:gliding motility-associated-like protein